MFIKVDYTCTGYFVLNHDVLDLTAVCNLPLKRLTMDFKKICPGFCNRVNMTAAVGQNVVKQSVL
jgi:hypothetical protein